MQETRVQSLGLEDPLEKGIATHSSILTWRIPWTEEPGGLQFVGSQRVRHDWATNTTTTTTNQQFCTQFTVLYFKLCWNNCVVSVTWGIKFWRFILIILCSLSFFSITALYSIIEIYQIFLSILPLVDIDEHLDCVSLGLLCTMVFLLTVQLDAHKPTFP